MVSAAGTRVRTTGKGSNGIAFRIGSRISPGFVPDQIHLNRAAEAPATFGPGSLVAFRRVTPRT